VGAAGAGSAGCIMDLEAAACDECCASWLPRMRDERRPLRRPRWRERCSHVVLRRRRWQSMMAAHNGSLCRPCTTRDPSSHAGLSPDASSPPVGLVAYQWKCTMRSSIGGCGFRATYLTPFGPLAARFCRRPGSVIPIAPVGHAFGFFLSSFSFYSKLELKCKRRFS
jgi:hypothetical protein